MKVSISTQSIFQYLTEAVVVEAVVYICSIIGLTGGWDTLSLLYIYVDHTKSQILSGIF